MCLVNQIYYEESIFGSCFGLDYVLPYKKFVCKTDIFKLAVSDLILSFLTNMSTFGHFGYIFVLPFQPFFSQ